ncbi:hypothetical protein OnM2_014003 [Erysiphe neolycopersici]|uniref:54S ribosomal protein L11, mitochondrial n=1 Tax=Erysiphe neolycopersici TaxID=212602 RepID=A0A420I5Q2_9PEZI|nr:hypothetical protein OnM2_014003 [Erysiphe neolycopersici]
MTQRIAAQVWTKLQPTSRRSSKNRIQIAAYATTSNSFILSGSASAAGTTTTLPPPLITPKYPSTQPPSHKPPEFRKSQLLRQYASLLRSSPLMLIFQHNNIKANEWLALRRELTRALRVVDKNCATAAAATIKVSTDISSGRNGNDSNKYFNETEALAPLIKIQTVQTGIFAAALKVVDYFKIGSNTLDQKKIFDGSDHGFKFTHTLSKAANRVATKNKTVHELSPLLSGPICVLYFPIVSPQHLKEAISILSPSPPDFPAPRKKLNPGWFDPAVQEAVQKLVLLGARIEKKTFDIEGIKMIGRIEGGLQGLQGQLLSLLQNIGITLTSSLETASKNLYLTLESRRSQLENNADSQFKSGDSKE